MNSTEGEANNLFNASLKTYVGGLASMTNVLLSLFSFFFRAVSTVTFLEGTFRVFICMKLTEITSNSFYYYQQSGKFSNLDKLVTA